MFKKFIIMLVTLFIIISLAGCTGGIVTPPQDDDNGLQLEQEFQDNQEMITHHLEEIAEPGKTPEQYAQELAALLINESQVSKVAVFENSINLTYASGKIHFIRFTDKEEGDEGYLIGGDSLHSSSALRDPLFEERDEVLFRGSSYQQREESSAIPLEERTIGIQDFTKSDQFRQTSSQEKLLQNRNILVWSPFTIYADALYLDLSLRLLGEDHLGFKIDLIRYKEATMDSLKEITNYGMVFLFAHGILPDGDSIVTGEEITKDNEYKMYIEGVNYTSEWKIISTPPFIKKKPDHFTVDYEWISKNVPKNANNKIVIANSCYLGNENMWEAFKSIGAGDYFGWDNDCTLPCVINRSADLLLKLKYGDSNTEDAYEPYSCSPYGANWLRFGDPVRFDDEEAEILDDETKIKSVINGFIQAFNDKDWDKARSYCVYGSVQYNETNLMEQHYYDDPSSVADHSVIHNISPININGQYAEAYVYFTTVFIYNGEIEELTGEQWIYLQKIANDWKIYDYLGTHIKKNDLIELKNIFILSIGIP